MTTRRSITAAGLCVLLPGLATRAGAQVTTGTPGTPDALIKVLVQAVASQPVYIARDLGVFARHGLQVEIAPAPTADAMMPQLLSGQAQFALASGLSVINAVTKGLKVRLVMSALNSSSAVPSSARLVVPEASAVKTVADLKGRSVAMGGLRSQPHLMVMAGAKELGVDPAQISFVEMPVPAMQAAAQKGTVDAVYPFEPYLGVLLKSGFRVVEPNLTKYLEGAPVIAFAASAEFLDRHAALARSFIAAMSEAYEMANRQPQLVRDVDLKTTKLPPEFIRSRDIPPFAAAIDKAALERMAQRMAEFGWIARVPAMGELLDAQAVAR